MTHSLWAEVKMPRAIQGWTSGSESASAFSALEAGEAVVTGGACPSGQNPPDLFVGSGRRQTQSFDSGLERVARALGADVEDLTRRPRR